MAAEADVQLREPVPSPSRLSAARRRDYAYPALAAHAAAATTRCSPSPACPRQPRPATSRAAPRGLRVARPSGERGDQRHGVAARRDRLAGDRRRLRPPLDDSARPSRIADWSWILPGPRRLVVVGGLVEPAAASPPAAPRRLRRAAGLGVRARRRGLGRGLDPGARRLRGRARRAGAAVVATGTPRHAGASAPRCSTQCARLGRRRREARLPGLRLARARMRWSSHDVARAAAERRLRRRLPRRDRAARAAAHLAERAHARGRARRRARKVRPRRSTRRTTSTLPFTRNVIGSMDYTPVDPLRAAASATSAGARARAVDRLRVRPPALRRPPGELRRRTPAALALLRRRCRRRGTTRGCWRARPARSRRSRGARGSVVRRRPVGDAARGRDAPARLPRARAAPTPRPSSPTTARAGSRSPRAPSRRRYAPDPGRRRRRVHHPARPHLRIRIRAVGIVLGLT